MNRMSASDSSAAGVGESSQVARDGDETRIPDELLPVRDFVESVGGVENARRVMELLGQLKRAA